MWLVLTNVPANSELYTRTLCKIEIILGTSIPKVKESPVKIERKTPTWELPKTLWAIPCSQNTVPTHQGAQIIVDVPTLKCVLLKHMPFQVS